MFLETVAPLLHIFVDHVLVVVFRYSLTFLSGMDVPVLYSPVPFQNAALSAPEVGLTDV